MDKISVNVNEVRALRKRMAEINAIPLPQIQWVDDNVPINVDPAQVEEWRFVGLNNTAFVELVIDGEHDVAGTEATTTAT